MSSKVVWLSHPLSFEIPAYGGGEGMRIEPGHANCSRRHGEYFKVMLLS